MNKAISITAAFIFMIGSSLAAEELPFLDAKVKTVVAFKDGTVFILKEGKVKVGKSGKVVTSPITDAAFGTVGASCSTDGVQVKMLTASASASSNGQPVTFGESRALTHGRPVKVKRRGHDGEISGELLGLRAPSPIANAVGMHTVTDGAEDFVLSIKQRDGLISLVPMSAVESWVFEDSESIERDPEGTGQHLRIALDGTRDGQEVTVSYYYLWRGVRWTPSYVLERDDEGNVRAELRGEVLNQLLDLRDTRLYLVVGVPNFAFHQTPSPMVAQKSLTQITTALSNTPQFLGNDFSNARFTNLVTNGQIAGDVAPVEVRPPAPGDNAAAPSLPNVANSDAGNLHLYEVENVDLLKGERAIINLDSMLLGCSDLVTWDIADARVSTATHEVSPTDRSSNPLRHFWLLQAGENPLTTGPALVMKGEVALSQDTIFYTPRGSAGRYRAGDAVSVAGTAEETVVDRTPGSKEVNDKQSSYQGKTFWLKKEVRWTDETRELKVTMTNGMTFKSKVEVSRVFHGIPEEHETVSFRALGGRSDSQDQVTRLVWSNELEPGETKEFTIRYTARIFE